MTLWYIGNDEYAFLFNLIHPWGSSAENLWDFDIYDPDIQILGHPVLYQRNDSVTAAKEKLLLYFVDENDHSIFAIESEDGEVMIAMEY